MDGLVFELVNQLRRLPSLLAKYDIEIYYGENREGNWIDVTHPQIQPISDLATWVIFTDRGHVNRQSIRDLRNEGYIVIPAEVSKDYGWITAGIEISGLFEDPELKAILTVYNDNLDNRWRKGN